MHEKMTSAGSPFALLLLLAVMKTGVDASCAAAGRCCEGKDNQCHGVVVYSNALRLENLLYGNLSKKSCFCDTACVELGDCCSDYRDHCPRERSNPSFFKLQSADINKQVS